MQQQLAFLQTLAFKAGQIMLENWGRKVPIYTKPDGTWVSEVDLTISTECCKRVKQLYPDYDLITEETSNRAVQAEEGFVIDELDGTHSFLRKGHGFAFQAAYFNDWGTPQVGIIYDPLRNLMVHAIKGYGVYLSGLNKTIKITQPPLRRWEYLRYANHRSFMTPTFRKVYTQLGVKQEQIVPTGAISAKVIDFVLGKVDALISLNRYIGPWDWAPGKVILEELGFTLTHVNGSQPEIDDIPSPDTFGYLVAPQAHIQRLTNELDWVQQKISGQRVKVPVLMT